MRGDLLLAASVDRLEAACILGLLLGLRPGEVFGLQWDDIDQAAGRLTVKQAIRRAGGDRFVLGEPKTKSSTRTLGMPTLVADALQRHRVPPNGGANGRRSGVEGDGSGVHHGRGGMINPSTSRGAFSRLTKSAGLAIGGHTN